MPRASGMKPSWPITVVESVRRRRTGSSMPLRMNVSDSAIVSSARASLVMEPGLRIWYSEVGRYEVIWAAGNDGGGRDGVGIGAAKGVSTRMGSSNTAGETPLRLNGMSAFGDVEDGGVVNVPERGVDVLDLLRERIEIVRVAHGDRLARRDR